MTPAAPLVDAPARCILRHQIGTTEPVQPPAWITAAATEIAAAIEFAGLPMSALCSNCGAPDPEDIANALDKEAP